MKVFLILLFVGGCVAYYFFIYRPAHATLSTAYALAASVDVVDAPTTLHNVIGKLKHGDRVEVRGRARNWASVRLADGLTGWVEAKSLLDAPTYDAAQRLLEECEVLVPQAAGHVPNTVNLRLGPSRDAPQIAQLRERQRVEIFGRRVVERAPGSTSAAPAPSSSASREVWYLVRAESEAGWTLGRLVDLDVPEAVAPYAQGTNLVAWLVLNTVDDNDRKQPQYLIADRSGAQEFDFNHIRVLTWWTKHHRYATAYVEGNLEGYFPIRVSNSGGVPYFRVRLIGPDGRKIQKVYGLFDTRTRPLGTVEGWETNALPARRAPDQKRTHPARPARAATKRHAS